MDKEELIDTIDDIFDDYFYGKSIQKIIPELKKAIPVLKELLDYQDEKPDCVHIFDDIPGHLVYISDRWNCYCRIEWIIKAMEKIDDK